MTEAQLAYDRFLDEMNRRFPPGRTLLLKGSPEYPAYREELRVAIRESEELRKRLTWEQEGEVHVERVRRKHNEKAMQVL